MVRPRKTFGRLEYCQYLLSSQTNYTITNYAEHAQTVSHDLVNKYLRTDKLSAKNVWDAVKNDIFAHPDGYIIFDDTVLDKNHSRHIDSVRWQYSGTEHKVIKGIGMVNCIYVNPETNQFWVIDYRIWDPSKDGKTKISHVQDMLLNIINHKQLSFKTILMDSWYSSNKLMLFIHELGKLFYCPVRKNRMLRPIDSEDKHEKITDLPWSDEQLAVGQLVQLKGMPKQIPLKMFSVSVSKNRTDYVVTNDVSQTCSDDTKQICAIRWYVEQFHRELKQLTGVEKCQCRNQRIQRNHIACAVMVWVFLKRVAQNLQTNVYQIKKSLMFDYLKNELRQPKFVICLS